MFGTCSFGGKCMRGAREEFEEAFVEECVEEFAEEFVDECVEVVALSCILGHVGGYHAEAEEIDVTAQKSPSAARVMEALRKGSQRYVGRLSSSRKAPRGAFYGELRRGGPLAAIVTLPGVRRSPDVLFDAAAGDLVTLRCTREAAARPEGGMVADVEHAVGALGVKVLLVLGCARCEDADCPADRLATQTEVLDAMEGLLSSSAQLRDKVLAGEVQVHGALLAEATGGVDFLGQHPWSAMAYGQASAAGDA